MIYFDNSATTKMYPEVLDTYRKVNEQFFGNPSSLHKLGNEADALLQQARKQIAQLLGARPDEIFFTSGGTESDNWAIKGTAMEKFAAGKHMIASAVEHPAVTKSLEQLEKLGFEITYLPVDGNGIVTLEELEKAIRKDTILVSVMAINNEVGSIQPIEAIGNLLENYPWVHFHVDAVQAVGECEPLIRHPRVDLLSLSAHKFHGPKGVGILYKKHGKRIAPLLTGGGQEAGMRSTTENVGGVAAMAKALRMALADSGASRKQEQLLRDKLSAALSEYEDVRIFSPEDGASHILCFAMKGVRGEVMVHAFESQGIFISTTSACSSRKKGTPYTLGSMGVPVSWSQCAVRISLAGENTEAEAEAFIEHFRSLHEKFQKIQ
ncbi:cysteine desulfurase family protein [Trichococcus ilyis]|jgi:cysteine desulfurase|uniref:Aminotransferases class-v pyridoxal-phosphate attachment site n=1 Tax=Trichococcus ilyis TaxID=640938 RepID=A0A143YYA3_9LACT|nr:cysteine desulfurase family protein [Trichococcus ilyis]CZR01583.1 aminotransferases class-v pyridoxal-phosphate attachment site [Trichococcus ilyis]SEJ25484.1 cysteine desulfurase [Trichococcus ilyis]